MKVPKHSLGKESTMSAIIPTYQEEKYIESTLAHLKKAKTFAKKKGIESEIIVVDSGNDRTFDIAKHVVNKVFKLNERGVSKARNSGAAEASGDILLFADADTIVPTNLFEQVQKDFSNREIVAAISYVLPAHSRSLSPLVRLFLKLDKAFITTCIRNCTPLLRFYTRGDLLVVRNEAFFDVGMFNENISCMEITELLLRLLKIGKVAVLGVPVYESGRRLQQCGVMRSYIVWWRNFISYYLLKHPFSKTWEAVR